MVKAIYLISGYGADTAVAINVRNCLEERLTGSMGCNPISVVLQDPITICFAGLIRRESTQRVLQPVVG